MDSLHQLDQLKQKKYKSFYDVLKVFPVVFSINQYHYITHDSYDSIKTNLKHWNKKGYVKSAGLRSKYYFNMIRDPHADKNYLSLVINKIYPDAIFTGVNILREADWTTQISQKEQFIIGKRKSYKSIYNTEIKTRTKNWYKQYQPGFYTDGAGKTLLKPEYALVDMCAHDEYIIDPDDLFLDDEEIELIQNTFDSLGVAPPIKYQEYLGFKDNTYKNTFKSKKNTP